MREKKRLNPRGQAKKRNSRELKEQNNPPINNYFCKFRSSSNEQSRRQRKGEEPTYKRLTRNSGSKTNKNTETSFPIELNPPPPLSTTETARSEALKKNNESISVYLEHKRKANLDTISDTQNNLKLACLIFKTKQLFDPIIEHINSIYNSDSPRILEFIILKCVVHEMWSPKMKSFLGAQADIGMDELMPLPLLEPDVDDYITKLIAKLKKDSLPAAYLPFKYQLFHQDEMAITSLSAQISKWIQKFYTKKRTLPKKKSKAKKTKIKRKEALLLYGISSICKMEILEVICRQFDYELKKYDLSMKRTTQTLNKITQMQNVTLNQSNLLNPFFVKKKEGSLISNNKVIVISDIDKLSEEEIPLVVIQNIIQNSQCPIVLTCDQIPYEYKINPENLRLMKIRDDLLNHRKLLMSLHTIYLCEFTGFKQRFRESIQHVLNNFPSQDIVSDESESNSDEEVKEREILEENKPNNINNTPSKATIVKISMKNIKFLEPPNSGRYRVGSESSKIGSQSHNIYTSLSTLAQFTKDLSEAFSSCIPIYLNMVSKKTINILLFLLQINNFDINSVLYNLQLFSTAINSPENIPKPEFMLEFILNTFCMSRSYQNNILSNKIISGGIKYKEIEFVGNISTHYNKPSIIANLCGNIQKFSDQYLYITKYNNLFTDMQHNSELESVLVDTDANEKLMKNIANSYDNISNFDILHTKINNINNYDWGEIQDGCNLLPNKLEVLTSSINIREEISDLEYYLMNSPISKNKRSTEESTDEFGSFVMLPTYDFSSHLDNYRRERNKYMNYLVCYDWIYPLDNAYLLHYLKYAVKRANLRGQKKRKITNYFIRTIEPNETQSRISHQDFGIRMNQSIKIENIIKFLCSFELTQKVEKHNQIELDEKNEIYIAKNSSGSNKLEKKEEKENLYENGVRVDGGEEEVISEEIINNTGDSYNINNYEIKSISSRIKNEIQELSGIEDYWISAGNLLTKPTNINYLEKFIASEEEEEISSDY